MLKPKGTKRARRESGVGDTSQGELSALPALVRWYCGTAQTASFAITERNQALSNDSFLFFSRGNVTISAEFGILMRRCFAFDDSETSLQLVDDRGCRVENLISEFVYDDEAGTADATIFSMFRSGNSSSPLVEFSCLVSPCLNAAIRE